VLWPDQSPRQLDSLKALSPRAGWQLPAPRRYMCLDLSTTIQLCWLWWCGCCEALVLLPWRWLLWVCVLGEQGGCCMPQVVEGMRSPGVCDVRLPPSAPLVPGALVLGLGRRAAPPPGGRVFRCWVCWPCKQTQQANLSSQHHLSVKCCASVETCHRQVGVHNVCTECWCHVDTARHARVVC
jgi:hypothetical protein